MIFCFGFISAQNIPKPRLDLNIYTGIVFVNSSNPLPKFSSATIRKTLNFPAQKEFGLSPNLGLEIFYPSSERIFIGFNFDYLQSNAIARYQDIFGSYDIEGSFVNYSYQLVPRVIIVRKKNIFWYIQAGIGGSLVLEEVKERLLTNSEFSVVSFGTSFESEYNGALYGFMFSASTGFNFYIKRFILGGAVGYRSSNSIAGGYSNIHGLSSNISIGFNFVK